MSQSGFVAHVLTAVVGGALGLLGALAVSRSTTAPVPAAPSASTQPAMQQTATAPPVQLVVTNWVVSSQSSAPRSEPSAPQSSPPTRAEAHANALALHEADIKAHMSSPRDALWANAMTSTIGDDLAVSAKKYGFDVESTDCRTSTCIAKLKFPSRTEAMRALDTIAHTGANDCTSRIVLPTEETTPFRATFFMECPRE